MTNTSDYIIYPYEAFEYVTKILTVIDQWFGGLLATDEMTRKLLAIQGEFYHRT